MPFCGGSCDVESDCSPMAKTETYRAPITFGRHASALPSHHRCSVCCLSCGPAHQRASGYAALARPSVILRFRLLDCHRGTFRRRTGLARICSSPVTTVDAALESFSSPWDSVGLLAPTAIPMLVVDLKQFSSLHVDPRRAVGRHDLSIQLLRPKRACGNLRACHVQHHLAMASRAFGRRATPRKPESRAGHRHMWSFSGCISDSFHQGPPRISCGGNRSLSHR